MFAFTPIALLPLIMRTDYDCAERSSQLERSGKMRNENGGGRGRDGDGEIGRRPIGLEWLAGGEQRSLMGHAAAIPDGGGAGARRTRGRRGRRGGLEDGRRGRHGFGGKP